MEKFEILLRQAKQTVKDFPKDWESWKYANHLDSVHSHGYPKADESDEIDFYLTMTKDD